MTTPKNGRDEVHEAVPPGEARIIVRTAPTTGIICAILHEAVCGGCDRRVLMCVTPDRDVLVADWAADGTLETSLHRCPGR